MAAAYSNITGWGDKIIIEQDANFSGTPEQAAIAKDIWALDLLANMGDCVVFDCDLTPTAKYDFSKPGVYAVYRGGVPSIEMMASVGDAGRAWFSARLQNKAERKIQDCWGFPNKLFQDMFLIRDGKPYIIGEEYYTHERMQSVRREDNSRKGLFSGQN